MAKKKFSELTPAQRAGVVGIGVVEVVLSVWAGRDLKRRPKDRVRGPKVLWALALPVQPIGPLGYLLLGRRR